MYTKSHKKFQHEDLALTVSALINCCDKKLSFHSVTFLIDSNADCYCLIKENILIKILNIIKLNNNIFLIGKRFVSCDSLYKYPFDSKKLKIFISHAISDEDEIWPIDLISAKCMVFPYYKKSRKYWVSFPLIHSIL